MEEKELNFSQKTAIKLMVEKIDAVFANLEQLKIEYQKMINTIAIEAGIDERDCPNWQLSKDETKFIKIKQEKKEDKK